LKQFYHPLSNLCKKREEHIFLYNPREVIMHFLPLANSFNAVFYNAREVTSVLFFLKILIALQQRAFFATVIGF